MANPNPVQSFVDPDTIFKVLRPVPEFDGNPNVLTRFIRLCDQICAVYLSSEPGSELSNLCLINGILNKITGPAARTINSNGIPESWLGIRTALINNFSDQRDETALYNDLSVATQGNNSPQEFYDRCQNLFSTIMTYVSLHEDIPTTIEAKRTLYKKLALQAFVRGLREPLGSRIRCMRPDSIEKALEFVQEETNVMYLQQRNDSLSERKFQLPKPVQMAPGYMPPVQKTFSPPAPIHMNVPFQRPAPAALQQPWKETNNPNFQLNRPPQGPSRTQQMFRALPPNYNPQSNVFKLPPRQQPFNNGPKPMSGVSHFQTRTLPPSSGLGGHNWMRSGNPPPNNYFKSREMNFNECSDYYDYNYYPDYYPDDTYTYYNDNPNCTYQEVTYDYDNCDQYEPYDLPEDTNRFHDDSLQDQPQPSTSKAPEQNFQKAQPSRKLR